MYSKKALSTSTVAAVETPATKVMWTLAVAADETGAEIALATDAVQVLRHEGTNLLSIAAAALRFAVTSLSIARRRQQILFVDYSCCSGSIVVCSYCLAILRNGGCEVFCRIQQSR